MKTDIKTKWVDALRSGEYRQGKDYLRTADRFCCLGVLCDLAVKDGIIPPPEKDERGRFNYDTQGHEEMVYLPLKVMEWADLEVMNPHATWRGQRESLAFWNDSGKDFHAIADMIEEQL